MTGVPKMSPMRSSKECIQRLVNKAEELVRHCGAQSEDLPRAEETALVAPAGPPLRAARCFEPLRFDGKRSTKLQRTKQWLKMHSHEQSSPDGRAHQVKTVP